MRIPTPTLNFLAVSCLLIIFLCTAIYLYTQWDLKRFKESLPSPAAENAKVPRRTLHEATEHTVPTANEETQLDAETEKSATQPSTLSESPPRAEESLSAEASDDILSERFLEETEDASSEETGTDVQESEDLRAIDPEAPYNLAVVKAGFDDYNANLESNPEYAYQRLEAAFREQYGDYPEVDILVETIRTNNNRALTVDEAINMTEALSRITPEPVASILQQRLEDLRETQLLEKELGEPIPVRYNMHFGQ